MEAKYNVIVVGKTGTGKSALINYLYGVKTREIGAGKPVTGKGFHPVDCEINGLPVTLFDSWGLEVGKDQEWMNLLDEELKKRDTGNPVEDWFHSVFYCIGGGGHRVETFDIKIIKRFIEAKYKVTVILTKADIISEDQEKELKDSILNDVGQAVPIIPVCSEEKKLRGGSVSEKFGKEDVELQAYNDFWDSIILRLPDRCEKVVIEYFYKEFLYVSPGIMEQIKAELRNPFSIEYNFYFDKMKKFADSLKRDGNPISELIIREVNNTIELYGNFAKYLNYPPKNLNRMEFNLNIPKSNILERFYFIGIADLWFMYKMVREFKPEFIKMVKEQVVPATEQLLKDIRNGKVG